MMKRGNEQEPKSGEILTTQEVAQARAIDRIVSVNVDRILCRAPTEEQRAKTDEIVRQVNRQLSEASNKAKPKHFPWLEVFVAIAAVYLIAAICFAIVMLAGGKS